MIPRVATKRYAQSVVVLLCAAAVKQHYATANVNQLRWILAPTAAAVELVSGARFEFEPYAGYVNGDRSFVIAASCAGVNFLLTAFLMLALGGLWRDRARATGWGFIPRAALCAYAATLVANTIRIATALQLHGLPRASSRLSPAQLHRLEGIVLYFGCLLCLFLIAERTSAARASSSEPAAGLCRRALCPLLIYYATTLGVPLVNGAYRQGADFREHALFVLLIPLLLILPLVTLRAYRVRHG